MVLVVIIKLLFSDCFVGFFTNNDCDDDERGTREEGEGDDEEWEIIDDLEI